MPGKGYGYGHSLESRFTPWTPAALGSDLQLWLRPEDLLSANRLLRTEDFSHAAWLAFGSKNTDSGYTDPDGGSTAWKLWTNSTSHYIRQSAQGFQVGEQDTFSFWAKQGPDYTSGNAYCRILDGVATALTSFTPSADWERVDVTHTIDAAGTKVECQIWPNVTNAGESLLVWHPQCELGTTVSDYVANTTLAAGQLTNWPDASGSGRDATQGTAASMPLVIENFVDGYHGVQSDGVDDFLSFTALSLGTAHEVWFVTEPADGTSDVVLGTSGDVQITGSDLFWITGDITGVNVLPGGETHLTRAIKDSSSDMAAFVDGVDVTVALNQTFGGAWNRLFRSGGTTYGGHIMVEFCAVDGNLSAFDAVLMTSYFRNKYPSLGIA